MTDADNDKTGRELILTCLDAKQAGLDPIMTRQDMRQTGRKRDMTRTQKARQETRLLSRARFPLGGTGGGISFRYRNRSGTVPAV